MRANKRPTANVPEELLHDAQGFKEKGPVRVPESSGVPDKSNLASVYEKAQRLRGRIFLDIDIEQSRERCRS